LMAISSPQAAPFPVTIRPMTLDDLESVHAIDVRSFSMPWSERSYRFELTENQNSLALVAEVNGADGARELAGMIVGMIVMWVILDEGHVATIAVHPDYRGHGIGRKLLAEGLQAAYARGAELSYLEVRRGNLAAQAMYREFGYVVVGERPKYYQDNNEDALLMTLFRLQPDELRRLAGA
jgi:ribosomal-protein-alanine N-acetyltransferase